MTVTRDGDERRSTRYSGTGSNARPGWLSRVLRLTTVVVVAGGLAAGLAGAIAQPTGATWQTDATPATDAVPCEVPPPIVELPRPAAGLSPASTSATPAASQSDGEPADDATTIAVDRLVRALAACLTDGDRERVARLVTERYLGAVYGVGGELSREEYLELAEALPAIPVAVNAVGDVRLTTAGASADVVYVLGHELIHARWSFLLTDENAAPTTASTPIADATGGFTPGSRWLVDAETPLPIEAPADTTMIQVGITEYDFRLDRRAVAGPVIVLQGENTGEEAHEMLVVRLGPGTRTDDLLLQPGPALPEGITFAGQVTIPAGETAELVLVDLEPGFYGIVCLLPAADGTPHLALGMRDRFEVT